MHKRPWRIWRLWNFRRLAQDRNISTSHFNDSWLSNGLKEKKKRRKFNASLLGGSFYFELPVLLPSIRKKWIYSNKVSHVLSPNFVEFHLIQSWFWNNDFWFPKVWMWWHISFSTAKFKIVTCDLIQLWKATKVSVKSALLSLCRALGRILRETKWVIN